MRWRSSFLALTLLEHGQLAAYKCPESNGKLKDLQAVPFDDHLMLSESDGRL